MKKGFMIGLVIGTAAAVTMVKHPILRKVLAKAFIG
jgi:ABC-type nitrate/sulfonate/bicarbonate transport system permease component